MAEITFERLMSTFCIAFSKFLQPMYLQFRLLGIDHGLNIYIDDNEHE
jgi:hypothetical protein